MKWTQRIAHALSSFGSSATVSSGRIAPKRAEDALRDYPSSGLTPSRLMAILREADSGAPAAAMELFEEMEEKDPHLFAVANTRRLALTGLEWRIVSAAEIRKGVDQGAAEEAGDYCRESLATLDGFDEVLQHLSLAVGRNIAIAELIWEVIDGDLKVSSIEPVDFTRIVFDELDSPRILTDEDPMDGMALPPNKFIVHTPHSTSGHPIRGGLLRVTSMAYLAKNLALKDWMIFAELFGMPVRVAQYEPSASAEEKREMLDMLDSLGSNAAGIFSRAVDLKFLEANRGSPGPPYGDLIDFLNREMSKAWLGQTLTTETTGVSGSFAATVVHEEVRKDLRAGDIRKEGRTIRRDLLAPLVRFKFGPSVPVPYFRRKLEMPADTQALAEVLDQAVNRLGIKVPAAWAHETLGIPRPNEREQVLSENAR